MSEPHIPYVEVGVYPVHVGATTSAKAFARELKRMGVEDRPFLPTPWAHAAVHEMDGDDGLVLIMALPKGRSRSPEQVAGLVAHEAMHVVQRIWSYIGEKEPGREAEAYLIQNIVQCCLEQVWKTGRSRRKVPKDA